MTWGHLNGGGWFLMTAFWLLIVVAAIIVIIRVVAGRPFAGIDGAERARGILAERFARGEIDADEYHERLDELNQHQPSG